MRKQKAFSLIEVLFTLGIIFVVASGIYTFLIKGRGASIVLNTKAQLNADARKAINTVIKDLSEANRNDATIDAKNDPIDGLTADVLVFPGRRGADGDASLASDGRVIWRSAIIICPYKTSEGIRQLRRYVDYNSNYNSGNAFPLGVLGLTATNINLYSAGIGNVIINRNSGEVLCNNLVNEEVNYELDSGLLTIVLTLQKELLGYRQNNFVTYSATNAVKLRN